jgi:hypothetical protein
MINPYVGNIANTKQEKYNVLRSAAERALLGWPMDDDSGRVKDPKKDNSPIPEITPPASPRVASRTMPGTTPMKTKGF